MQSWRWTLKSFLLVADAEERCSCERPSSGCNQRKIRKHGKVQARLCDSGNNIVRKRMGMACCRWQGAEDHADPKPRLAIDAGEDSSARNRCVGTCLLS